MPNIKELQDKVMGLEAEIGFLLDYISEQNPQSYSYIMNNFPEYKMQKPMKINLHCHTNYSDGRLLSNMFYEHRKQGYQAFVCTDHVYPSHYGDRSLTWEKFKEQRFDLANLSDYSKYPSIQGIELCLGIEEILVFGYELIKGIFGIIESSTELPLEDLYSKLISYIKDNKDIGACILCHPSLYPDKEDYYKQLFPILDGYERYNSGHNMFSYREVPEELSKLKAFYNSDAHMEDFISRCNNVTDLQVTTEQEVIKWIKL